MLKVSLEIGNVTSRLTGLDRDLAQWLDAATRYPTPQAHAQAGGWRPPEDALGAPAWDGFVHLARFYPNGSALIPTGLALRVHSQLARHVQWEVADHRVRPEPGIPDRPALPLRSYQEAAADEAIRVGYGVIDAPPRSGKTRLALEIQRRISLPTLWIAPTTNIVSQTVRAAEEFFGKHYMEQVAGTRQALEVAATGAPVIICTAATAAALPESFFARIRVVIADEFHHAASASWRSIMDKTHHVFHRYGMTGTFLRSGEDEMAMHAVLSNVIWKIGTGELARLGHLVPARVVWLPVNSPRIPHYAGKPFQAGAGRHGVFQHAYRNSLAVWAASTLWSRQYQSVTLVGTKEQGRTITEGLRSWVPRGSGPFHGAEFVSTDRPPQVCREVIDAFVARQIPALVGTSMIGEGTDLPSADALVYAPGGKAEVSQTQANFRICTAAPGKRPAVIVDFIDRHHDMLLRHAMERLETYYGQETFQTQVLEDVGQFPAFLDSAV